MTTHPPPASRLCYWTATTILAFVLLTGGVASLLQRPENVAGMAELGYPAYLLLVLGGWKVLGGITVLVPGVPRLKEWAYAGSFFDLTGAAISHACCGDGLAKVLWPTGFAACTMVSWWLRPADRTLAADIGTPQRV